MKPTVDNVTFTTVTVRDRNEAKFLFALGFEGKPSPRDEKTLYFEFDATEELFEARNGFSINAPCPVQSYIKASMFVDKCIYDHRNKGGER